MRREAGFTLVEALVAIALLGIVSTSLTASFIRHLKTNTSMEVRSGAYAAAQVVLDQRRFEDPFGMPTSGNSGPQEIVSGGRTYQVITYYCENPAHCVSQNTRHLAVEVLYKGERLYEVETVYTRLK